MIEVRDSRLGKAVHATRPIEPGQVILSGWGPEVPVRTRHSFQVGLDTHIEIDSPIELINHSCEPNCGVFLRRGVESLEIHALRRIEPGEELTTDYATFEADIENMPGSCLCGSTACRGAITGYSGLPPGRRRAFGRYIADYLRDAERQLAPSSPS